MMEKYRGKEDYSTEDPNMIMGVGFDEIGCNMERLNQSVNQRLACIETKIDRFNNVPYFIERIFSEVYEERKMLKLYCESVLDTHRAILDLLRVLTETNTHPDGTLHKGSDAS